MMATANSILPCKYTRVTRKEKKTKKEKKTAGVVVATVYEEKSNTLRHLFSLTCMDTTTHPYFPFFRSAVLFLVFLWSSIGFAFHPFFFRFALWRLVRQLDFL